MVQEHEFDSRIAADKTVEAIRAKLGLDKPIHVQYVRWIGGIITRGSLGKSLWKNTEVSHEIGKRLPTSIELVILSTVFGLLIGIPLGVFTAIRQDSLGDYLGRGISIAFIAIPYFWIGTLVMVFPSIWWGWMPPLDYISFSKDPLANLGQFIIPAVLISLLGTGHTVRMTRTMMLEVLRQDYIRTAWSKGLRERQVVRKHALKNALIPVVTAIGNSMPIMIASAVVAEQIFVLPGIGRLLLWAIANRDYTVIAGTTVVISCFVVGMNLLVDVVYAYLDPRIHYR
jgi:peptide/nickel transport system permease protein